MFMEDLYEHGSVPTGGHRANIRRTNGNPASSRTLIWQVGFANLSRHARGFDLVVCRALLQLR